jgi:hypothetical protein
MRNGAMGLEKQSEIQTAAAEQSSTAKCARPPSPALLTLFTRTGRRHGRKTTMPRPTRSRPMVARASLGHALGRGIPTVR